MFLASTRCGLIACRYLVKRYHDNTYASAPEIAEQYNMNVRALMPALRQLTRSGILHSRVGGKTPGFIFSRHPQQITILDILTALEGENSIICCKELIPDLSCDCRNTYECSIHTLFGGMMEEAKERLSKISLEEHSKMYNIELQTI